MHALLRWSTIVAVALIAMACGSALRGPATRALAPAPPASAAHIETPCEKARTQRARVPGLLAQGRLDRTLRVIEMAKTSCPAEAPSPTAG